MKFVAVRGVHVVYVEGGSVGLGQGNGGKKDKLNVFVFKVHCALKGKIPLLKMLVSDCRM